MQIPANTTNIYKYTTCFSMSQFSQMGNDLDAVRSSQVRETHKKTKNLSEGVGACGDFFFLDPAVLHAFEGGYISGLIQIPGSKPSNKACAVWLSRNTVSAMTKIGPGRLLFRKRPARRRWSRSAHSVGVVARRGTRGVMRSFVVWCQAVSVLYIKVCDCMGVCVCARTFSQ